MTKGEKSGFIERMEYTASTPLTSQEERDRGTEGRRAPFFWTDALEEMT